MGVQRPYPQSDEQYLAAENDCSRIADNVEKPLISVIMPCYNAETFLRDAITSVLAQAYSNFELIVIDDGSTDGSRGILREYDDRVVILEQDNQGPYPARNLGLKHARGQFVAFLDADDWWRLDFLEKMYSALLENEDAVLSYCGWQIINSGGSHRRPHIPADYEKEGKAEPFLRAASPWPIHAALVRRSVIEEISGFQTYLPTCMDYDFWLRIGMAHRIVLVPEVMSFYRHHSEGQIISEQWRQAQNVWVVKKNFVKQRPDLFSQFSSKELRDLIDGALLRRGYDNYWRRDLVSARRIFRRVLRTGSWKLKDLRYLLPALLPERLYLKLISLSA